MSGCFSCFRVLHILNTIIGIFVEYLAAHFYFLADTKLLLVTSADKELAAVHNFRHYAGLYLLIFVAGLNAIDDFIRLNGEDMACPLLPLHGSSTS